MRRTKIFEDYSLEKIEDKLNRFYEELEKEIKLYKIDDVRLGSLVSVRSTQADDYGVGIQSLERYYAVVNYTIYDYKNNILLEMIE